MIKSLNVPTADSPWLFKWLSSQYLCPSHVFMSHLLKNVCEKVTQTSTGNLLIIHLIYLCFSTIIPDQGEKGLALLPVYTGQGTESSKGWWGFQSLAPSFCHPLRETKHHRPFPFNMQCLRMEEWQETRVAVGHLPWISWFLRVSSGYQGF